MAGLRGQDKQQDDLVNTGKPDLPEGLKRKPIGPGDKPNEKERERNDKIVAEQVAAEKRQSQVPSPGEPAGGE